MRILVMGDIGGDSDFHVGDEAMLESALVELGTRTQARFTVVSADPAASERRYGVDSVSRFGFSFQQTPSRAARDDRLGRIIGAARGRTSLLQAGDSAWQILEAVSDSDAVLIAGGGNLTSAFVEHIYERAALAALSSIFGKPLVVTGQSLGPSLSQRDAELVGEILATATLVGVREFESYATALDLGAEQARLALTVDDASFLRMDDSAEVLESLGIIPGKYVAVSFPDYAGALAPEVLAVGLRRMIARVRSLTKLKVVVIPHHGVLGEMAGSDDVMAQRLSGSGVIIAPVLAARQVAALTAAAALSISGRYHPAVFALAAGVPAVGVWVDDYTRRKIAGALDNFGVGAFAIPSGAVMTSLVDQLVAEVWQRRTEIRGSLASLAAVRRAESDAWWDTVTAALGGGAFELVPPAIAQQLIVADSRLNDDLVGLSKFSAQVFGQEALLKMELGVAYDRHQWLETAAAYMDARLAPPPEPVVTNTERGEGLAYDLERQIEALEQRLWERERMISVRAREVAELRVAVNSARHEIGALTSSTSWKVSLPLRILRNPRAYAQRLRRRGR